MDMLANIDVFGKSTPTMRFMGGREYDYLVKHLKFPIIQNPFQI